MQVRTRSLAFGMVLGAAIVLLGCGESTDPASPRLLSGSASAAATKDYFEVPVSFEGPLNWVTCVDANDPPLAHVNGTLTFDVVTTPSGISSTRNLFAIDRDETWVIYNGKTYQLAPGRIGHDDIVHILEGPDGLHVETMVEPDFLASGDRGDRLRFNFTFVFVIDPNGNTRVLKSTGACPLIVS
jgi:hypothetical protein